MISKIIQRNNKVMDPIYVIEGVIIEIAAFTESRIDPTISIPPIM